MDTELEAGSRVDLRKHVEALLSPGRYVTLTGAGGVGKTWLARRIEPEIATFVDCVAANTREDLVRALADATGCHGTSDDPGGFAQTVVEHCSLLVVDNLEQIVDASRPVIEELAAAGGRVLCTSRVPLGGRSEYPVALDPLPFEEALAYFRRRADPATPESDDRLDGADLVRFLGGNPLALEIAAAHTRLATPHQLLAHLERWGDLSALDGRQERHSSLSALGEHTWNLLGDAERAGLRTLGHIEGTWTVEVARRVGVDARTVDALSRWSLVKRERGTAEIRLLLPAVLRGWLRVEHPATLEERTAVAKWAVEEGSRGMEGLGRAGEYACVNRLGALYPDLMNVVREGSLEPDLRSRALVIAARYLGARHQDRVQALIAAHRDLIPTREADRVTLIVADARALRRLGRQDEGLAVIDGALEKGWSPASEGRLRVERSFQLAYGRGRAEAHLEARRAVALLDGHRTVDEVLAHRQLGVSYRLIGRHEEARRALDHAVSLARAGGFVLNEVTALSQLMQLDHFDIEALESLYRQSIAAAELSGHPVLLALIQGQYATRMLWEGELERADRVLESAAATFRRGGLRTAADNLVCRRALAEVPAPSIPEARARLQALLDEVRSAQVSHYEGEILAALAAFHHLEGAYDEARSSYIRAHARASELGHHGARKLIEVLSAVLEAEVSGHAVEPGTADAFPGYMGRLRHAMLEHIASAQVDWVFQTDARAFITPDGQHVGLGRRQGSRRVLEALVDARVNEPGRSLTTEELFARGWPGQTIRHASAQARLWTAIRDLRSLGLHDLLETSGDGYRLAPHVSVERRDELT